MRSFLFTLSLLSACSPAMTLPGGGGEGTDDGSGLVWGTPAAAGSSTSTDTGTPTDTPDTSEPDTGQAVVDEDGDGVPAESDCNDADPEVSTETTWSRDADGDGYGDPDTVVIACSSPGEFYGHPWMADDCDDSNAAVNGGATEVADYVDNDCDGVIDGVMGWCCPDVDDDGYGATTGCSHTDTCSEDGFTWGNGDCEDTNSTAHPGRAEVIGDGTDNDCDGVVQ